MEEFLLTGHQCYEYFVDLVVLIWSSTVNKFTIFSIVRFYSKCTFIDFTVTCDMKVLVLPANSDTSVFVTSNNCNIFPVHITKHCYEGHMVQFIEIFSYRCVLKGYICVWNELNNYFTMNCH